MEDISELFEYFAKIKRAIDNADFTFLKYKFVKKARIDDLLVCTLALLPKSFKEAIKRKLIFDRFPAVACYSRLSKLLKRQFPFFSNYYMVDFNEAYTMLKGINRDLSKDLKNLEDL